MGLRLGEVFLKRYCVGLLDDGYPSLDASYESNHPPRRRAFERKIYGAWEGEAVEALWHIICAGVLTFCIQVRVSTRVHYLTTAIRF